MADPKDQSLDNSGIAPTDQAEGERNENTKQTKVQRNPDQAEGGEEDVQDIPGADKGSDDNSRNPELQKDPGGHS